MDMHRPKRMTAEELARKSNGAYTGEVIRNILGDARRTSLTPGFVDFAREALGESPGWPFKSIRKPISDPAFQVTYDLIEMQCAGKIPCGKWSELNLVEDHVEVEAKYWKKDRFCAWADGHSNHPYLQDEDFIMLDPDNDPPLGKIVLAQRDDDQFATAKVMEWDERTKTTRLRALNDEHDDAEAEKWSAIALLVYVEFTNEYGEEIKIYREKDGIRPETLLKMRT